MRAASTVLFGALQRIGTPQKTLAELTETPQYGFTASSSIEPIGPKFVRITDIQDGAINWDSVPYCQCQDSDNYLLKPNDILFARTGATTGKTYIVKETPFSIFASYLIRIRPKLNINPAYLYSFFQSDLYWSQIAVEKEGSAQPNVNGKKLSSVEMPLVDSTLQSAIARFLQVVRDRQDGSKEPLLELPPPLSEQRRIVARIEELAAKIEEARGLRKKAGEEIEVLIASVLSSILKPSYSEKPQFLEDYIVDIRYGTSEKCSDEEIGPAVLRMGNIQNGQIRFSQLKYLEPENIEPDLYLGKGDILFNRTNSAELVGKCGVFESDLNCTFASYLIRVRLDVNRAIPKLVAFYINSPLGRKYITSEIKQQCGQANVNSKKLKKMPIILPPLPEQLRIVAYLDALQAKVDAIGRLQAETGAELNALMPAVLDKAFKGEM